MTDKKPDNEILEKDIKTMSVYEKWYQIMVEVEYLNKDTNIAYGKQNYNAVSEEGVLNAIRPRLIKYRLIVIPEKVKVLPKIGAVSSVEVDYRIINVDNPEEFILISSAGEGADTQDKGIGKALTYSKKYTYLKGMDIITGDDPDKTSSKEIDDKLKKKAEAEKKAKGKVPAEDLSVTQIKKLFFEYHDGDKDEAKSDYELWKDMPEPSKSETLENIKSKIKEKAA